MSPDDKITKNNCMRKIMIASKYILPLVALLTFVGCQTAPAVNRQQIDYKYICKQAESISKEGYSEPSKIDNNLSSAEYGQVTFNSAKELWREGKLPYRLEFYHLGYMYNSPVVLNEFKGDYSQELRFTNDLFNFGNLDQQRTDYIKTLNQGYSGFKILCQLNRPGQFDELISFLGNSRFRALGRYNIYGVYATAFLTKGQDGGIEIGHFSDYWLGKPSDSSTNLTIYAIADASDAVSAYKFEISQGDTCAIKVSQTVYPRKELYGIGIAPMSSVYMFGKSSKKSFGSYYPEMHFSDGLVVKTDDNCIFQPLENYSKTVLSEFATKNLKYFGLFQRNRNYEDYQTPFSPMHLMPNLWIAPSGNWGEGKVELVQVPANNIDSLNIYAFWTPKDKLTPEKSYTFEYTMNWSMNEPDSTLGHVVSTRAGTVNNTTTFSIKFTGDNLQKLSAVTNLTPNIKIDGNAKLTGVPQILKDPYDNAWRVLIPVTNTNDPAKSNIATINCTLFDAKVPVSETWSYKWIP